MSSTDDRITVLHVDDDPGMTDLVATFLEREDDRLDVITATSVDEGLRRLSESEVDCIVSDHDMPGRDGIDFLTTVRESHEELPFILFTGKGSEEVASRAISAGVTDYLQKGGGTDQYAMLAKQVISAVGKRRAEERMQLSFSAMETAQEGISIIDTEGNYLYVNRAYAETFGYDPEEMVGQSWSLIYPEEQVERAQEEILPAVPETGRWVGETVHVRKDGSRIVSDHALSFSEEGMLFCTLRDITEELERESALREQRTRLDLFVDAVEKYAIFSLDPEGYVTSWNRGASRIKGYDAEEILGEHFSRFYPEEKRQEGLPERLLERAKSEGSVTDTGWRVRKDGGRFWADVTITAVYDDEGRLRGFEKVTREVEGGKPEDREERERKLTRLHDATRSFVKADSEAEIAAVAVEAVHDILEMPVAGCWLYDADREVLEPVASTDESDAIVDEMPVYERGQGLVWEAFDAGEVRVYDDVSSNPDRHNPETNIKSEVVLPLGEYGALIIGSTEPGAFSEMEVSLAQVLANNAEVALERTTRMTQLREEQAFTRAALNSLLDTFYVFDAEANPVRWNERLLEVTGYTDEEIAEMAPVDFFAPEDKARVAETIAEVFRTGQGRVQADFLTKDGQRIPYEFTGTRLTDPDGRLLGFVGIGRDISEQQERERTLERRNERLDEFASIVSHDLRNPLSVAKGHVELAREECDSDHLDTASRAHDRMETLIEDLLALSREEKPATDLEAVSLPEATERAWANVETGPASLVVETEREIRADESRLLQLLENLMRNAVEYGGEDVRVTVGDLDDGFYVEDDGSGIPESEREQVFESGYSTSEEGTGFGLSIVERIATAHEWNVAVTESAEGGARFEITGVDSATAE